MPTLKYPNSPGTLSVSMIRTWDRANLPHRTEAPTLRNAALDLFDMYPQVDRVVLCCGNAMPLFLMRTEGNIWRDMSGKQVTTARE